MADKDLIDYLPNKFRVIDAWKDYVETIDVEVYRDFRDTVSRLLKVRDPREIDEEYLEAFLDLLGFYRDIVGSPSTLTTDQVREFLATLPDFYDKRATPYFVRVLSYLMNTTIILEELYSRDKVVGESLGNTFAGIYTYGFMLDKHPVTPASVSIVIDTFDTIVDDGFGRLYDSSNKQVGAIDYLTGVFYFTLQSSPPGGLYIYADYRTLLYQGFFSISQLPPGISYTYEGGEWYKTCHVNLAVDAAVYPTLDLDRLRDLFYYLAPAVLVLNTIALLIDLQASSSINAQAAYHITVII